MRIVDSLGIPRSITYNQHKNTNNHQMKCTFTTNKHPSNGLFSKTTWHFPTPNQQRQSTEGKTYNQQKLTNDY